MIRPAHLIRRTTSCLADLTLNAVASTICWHDDLCNRFADMLARRWREYQAGAQAAIRGDELPFNVTEINAAAEAFAAYDHDVALPDPCSRCGHKWHGLACTSCSCASAWKESA